MTRRGPTAGLILLARPTGFESVASAFGGQRSIADAELARAISSHSAASTCWPNQLPGARHCGRSQ